MAFTIKENDTRPRWQVPLEADGSAVDLTDATSARFLMRLAEDQSLKVDEAITITDAPNGVVQYTFDALDTDTPGAYEVEVEVTWDDGGIETYPNDSYWDVIVKDDIA